MAVYLHQRFSRSRWFRSARRCGWLPRLVLPVLAILLVELPVQCWAEADAAQAEATEKPVTGAGIVDEYFPGEPESKDVAPDDSKIDPDDSKIDDENAKFDNVDENLNKIPPAKQPPAFFGKFKVTLPEGETEIIHAEEMLPFLKGMYLEKQGKDFAVQIPWTSTTYSMAPGSAKSAAGYFVNAVTMKFDVEVVNESSGPMEVIMLVASGMAAKGGKKNKEALNCCDDLYKKKTTSGGWISQDYALGVDGVFYHTRDSATSDGEYYRGENIFRDIVLTGDSYKVTVARFYHLAEHLFEDDEFAELVVILRKPTTCLMQVTYEGDLEGADFGDLAYYNNFLKEGSRFAKQGGVAIATGSGADEEGLLMIESAIGGGQVYSKAEYQAMTGKEVDVFADDPNDPNSPYSADPPAPTKDLSYTMHAFEDFATGRGEVDKSELETFGLSMAGRKPNDRINPMEAFLQSAGSAAIEVASRAKLDKFFYQESDEDKNEKSKEKKPIYMVLSRVTMRVKERFDDGTAALFTWKAGEDAGPAPKLEVYNDPGILGFSGRLTGTLTAKNYRLPNGKKAQIKVTAKFIAAEGAFGCDLGSR
jgi:hypothetical protein